MFNFFKKASKPTSLPLVEEKINTPEQIKHALSFHKIFKFKPQLWPTLIDFFTATKSWDKSLYYLARELKESNLLPNFSDQDRYELAMFVTSFCSSTNLTKSWKESGIKTFKIYTGEDDKVCKVCKYWENRIIPINLLKVCTSAPPFPFCRNPEGCRCYARPESWKSI